MRSLERLWIECPLSSPGIARLKAFACGSRLTPARNNFARIGGGIECRIMDWRLWLHGIGLTLALVSRILPFIECGGNGRSGGRKLWKISFGLDCRVYEG